jgi:fatty-acyl-CoA synthase
MDGLNMDTQLTLPAILRRAETLFAARTIVSRRPDRSLWRYTYGGMAVRAKRLAIALRDLGVGPGDRVATLGWNHHQHLETYFAIPALGAVLHTLNLRLAADELAYAAADAGDRFLLADASLLPLCEQVAARVPFEGIIVMAGGSADPRYLDYEALVAGADERQFAYRDLDERSAAAMCYTSGTTGRPKGAVYSHRAMALHAMACAMAGNLGVAERDTVLAVVPMFHINAWGLPFTAALAGAAQVLPGPHLDPASLLELLSGEGVTITAGVPTVWLGVLQLLDEQPARYDLGCLRVIVTGGSAVPQAMIQNYQERHGLHVLHAWGMTETTSITTLATLPSDLEAGSAEAQYRYRATQGTPLPFIEVRARGDAGLVPWDGTSLGELEVRGPWVARQYHHAPAEDDRFTADGWLRTGDIVTIDPRGCVCVSDRTRDLVKSGGEWISSVALENALMAHPAVAEAAVVAVAHPRWGERPLAAVVLKANRTASAEELRRHLEPGFPKWWLPDAIEFVREIPRTSAGKFKKSELRERFRERYEGAG